MSLEECLSQLADPAARLSLRLLTDLSDLDGRQTDLFVGVWTTVDTSRRLRIVLDLTDLAEDNVDLHFETGFRLGAPAPAAVRQALTAAVEDPEQDETVRARAIEALGALSGEEIQNLIESVYEEASIDLKIGAVDAMGRSCDEYWLPIVLRELTNEAPEMRHAAAFAAGLLGAEEAVSPLADLAMYDP